MKSISGKIVNHSSIFNGTIEFSKNIESVSKQKDLNTENIIIPGFVDLHCHGGKGFDTMAGLSSIRKCLNIILLTEQRLYYQQH